MTKHWELLASGELLPSPLGRGLCFREGETVVTNLSLNIFIKEAILWIWVLRARPQL